MLRTCEILRSGPYGTPGRYRALILHDNVRLDAESQLWEPTAKFIARQFPDPNNPPVKVELHRHWAELPDPRITGGGKASPAFEHYTFYQLILVQGASP